MDIGGVGYVAKLLPGRLRRRSNVGQKRAPALAIAGEISFPVGVFTNFTGAEFASGGRRGAASWVGKAQQFLDLFGLLKCRLACLLEFVLHVADEIPDKACDIGFLEVGAMKKMANAQREVSLQNPVAIGFRSADDMPEASALLAK